ncbi:hypothetical protein BH10BDE1_BH10BDE1_07640 [soil metagenome]
MKEVLILGATGGIGSACSKRFSSENGLFRITEVSRKVGDLRSREFRAVLAERENPHIVISTFGTAPNQSVSYVDAIEEHAISVIDLYEKFEAKGRMEHFVVLSSLSALSSSIAHVFQGEGTHKYLIAKRMLSDFFRQSQLFMKSHSKVMVVEPGYVRTNFADIANRAQAKSETDFIMKTKLSLIEPSVIANEIFRVVTDPALPSMSMTYFNRSLGET